MMNSGGVNWHSISSIYMPVKGAGKSPNVDQEGQRVLGYPQQLLAH